MHCKRHEQRKRRYIGGRPHLIIIDDDSFFRDLLVGVLRSDFQLTVADDGANGFTQALDDVPDFALIDVQMPGWDGLETLRAFRSHPSLKGVKVVMLTADASRETLVAAIKEGAEDYLVKIAFSGEELLQKLRAMQARSSKSLPILDLMPPIPMPSGIEYHRENRGHFGEPGVDTLQETIDSWE